MDYKEKIRRLLALAESPNENEAKAALLKARELMAENKITHSDILESKDQKVSNIKTEWTCSKRRDPWMVQLAATISEHYCCRSYISRGKGKQINTIGFIGIEDDMDVCMEVFNYAARFVTVRTKEIKTECSGCGVDVIRSESDSYGYGFIKGLNDAYDEQLSRQEQFNDEWALVLNIPKEVNEASDRLKHTRFEPRTLKSIRRDNYLDGYKDGRNFDAEKMLKEEKEGTLMYIPAQEKKTPFSERKRE